MILNFKVHVVASPTLRPGVRVWCVVVGGRAFESCLEDFLRLVSGPVVSSSRSVVFRIASVEPVSFDTLWLSLLRESSTTVSRVHRRGSDPLSSPVSRRRGSTLSPSVCRLSHRPSLSSNPAVLPRRVPFGLPEP